MASRTKELLDEELAQEKHKQEVKDLEEAISITAVPQSMPNAAVAAARSSSGRQQQGQQRRQWLVVLGCRGACVGPGGSRQDGRGSPDGTAADMPPAAPFKLISEGRRAGGEQSVRARHD